MRTFEEILKEQVYELKNHDNKSMNSLRRKGYSLLITPTESNRFCPDVHGIPDGYIAYGRGGVRKDNTLFLDGGPNGSSNGHPNDIKNGFYWGAFTTKDGHGIVAIRGRADTSPNDIRRMEVPIVNELLKRLPKAQ
jgi:hypothetical protein